jgi:MFS family permease
MHLRSILIDVRPLGLPAFRRLWIASAVTAVGGSFSAIAVPLQLFELTGSSAYAAAAAAISMAALIASALGAGTIADSVDRRRVLFAGGLLLGLAHAGLWFNTATGLESVTAAIVLVGLQGLGVGATMTASGAAVPQVVPAELLAAASSLSSFTRYTGAVVGPLLAGLLIPRTGLAMLYLADALALLVMLWAVAQLPPLMPQTGATPDAKAIAPGILAGFRYLSRQRLLVAVLAVDLAAMVFSMPVVLYPELVSRTYRGDSTDLSLLFAAYPAGVLLAGMFSGTFTRARRHGTLMASAAIAWGGCVITLGLSTDLHLALVVLVLGGTANHVLSTTRNAITQAYTDPAMLGRIQGSLVVVLIGGPQLANVLHGAAGAAVGARPAIAVGGGLTIVAVIAVLHAAPELWRYVATSSKIAATR